MSSGRRSKGRQKIEMKKMTNENNLQVTFSKRRSGIFKKASELNILCAAEVALIIFSPTNKVFSFGHPNVDALLHRYLMGASPHAPNTMHHFLEAHRDARVCELNTQLKHLTNEFEAGKKHIEELNKLHKARQVEWWWTGSIQEMNIQQLKQMKFAVEELKKTVDKHKSDNILIQTGAVVAAMNPDPFLAAGSSSLSSNLALPSPMFQQTPMFQNPQLLQTDPNLGLNMMMMNPYGFHNIGGYGPRVGFY